MTLPFILHISAIKTWGGGEQQLVYLYQELAKQLVPQLIVCKANSALAEYCDRHQLKYVTYSNISSIDFRFAWQLKRLCESYPIDIIHTHDAHSQTAALIARLLFRIKPKLVTSRKVAFPISKSWLSRYKYNSKQLSKIICISQAVHDIVAQTVKDTTKLAIVPDGIDLTRFDSLPTHKLREELQLPKDCYLVGTAAALVASKDLFTFIDVAKRIIEQGITAKFLIMGEGPLKAELQMYAVQTGVAEQLIFLGFRTDVATLLPQLDVFMLTSRQEGLGSVILEAMASQVPVVATRVGGIPEIVLEGKTGLLAACGDVIGLSDAVIQLLHNKLFTQQLVQQAKQQLTEFSIQTMAAKSLLIYQNL